jgi:hypothetical protein
MDSEGDDMNEAVYKCVTKEQLEVAFHVWVNKHRAGNCTGYEVTDATPSVKVAEEQADFLWSLL